MKRRFEGILKDMPVTLVMGGPGKERDVSLRSGAAVAGALKTCGAHVTIMDITGPDFQLSPGTKLVFNMIHGTFGEDGELQSLLDAKEIPYTGEDAQGSRLAFDKIETKTCFERAHVPTAPWKILYPGESPDCRIPCVVKAPRQGSSIGVHIVHAETELPDALADCFQYDHRVLVEEFFPGRELTVGVLGNVALPIVEIVPQEGFYDYAHKYTKGASEYHVPAVIPQPLSEVIQNAALSACQALGLHVYSRVDILLAPDGRINVIEINTIPGMTETSLLPKAAAVAGLNFAPLCEEIAGFSLARYT